MDENLPRYLPISKEKVAELCEKQNKIIDSFISSNMYNNDEFYIDNTCIYGIITKTEQRRQYFKYFHGIDMSEYKETALTSFWCLKFKPLTYIGEEVDSKKFKFINEKLAVYIILFGLRCILKEKGMSADVMNGIPNQYLNELIYSFAYRDISKEALILLVESIAVFLNLNPYADQQQSVE